MVLPSSGLLGSSSLILSLLLLNGSFDLSLFILLEPLSLSLFFLFKEDVLLSGGVDVLQEVDLGLLFSLPLCVSHLSLSLGFDLYKLINQFFVLGFVVL